MVLTKVSFTFLSEDFFLIYNDVCFVFVFCFPAQHQTSSSAKSQENYVHGKTENRAAYIPFPAPVADTLKLTCESKPAFTSTPSQSSSSSPLQPPIYSLSSVSPVAVDLHVTNLDQSIGAKEMKTLITSVFKQHVLV